MLQVIMVYAVYIVECADGSLYTGIATDVQRRLLEHNGIAGKSTVRKNHAARGKGARYTAARRPVILVLEMPFGTRSQAAKEEARIKRLSRDQKQLLISTVLSSQAVRA